MAGSQAAIRRLTPRQREVIELLARGYTNPQIGEALGISLDGAKWHVAEIMSRLGASSREEAASQWRQYNRWPARMQRAARVLLPVAMWARWATAAAGVGVVSAIAIVIVVAMSSGSGDPARARNGPRGNLGTPAASSSPSSDTSIESAVTRLDAINPQWSQFIHAVDSNDVDSVLGFMGWQQHPCTPSQNRIGDSPECSALGLANGSTTLMFPAGSAPLPTGKVDPAQVFEDVSWNVRSGLRATFQTLLDNRHPSLDLVAVGSDGRAYISFALDRAPDASGFVVQGVTFQMESTTTPTAAIYSETGNQDTPLSDINDLERGQGQHFDIWGVSPALQQLEAQIQAARDGP